VKSQNFLSVRAIYLFSIIYRRFTIKEITYYENKINFINTTFGEIKSRTIKIFNVLMVIEVII